MWLREVLDVTSYSEIQQPYPPWRQGQGGVHPTEAEYGRESSDGTDGAMVGLSPPEARETKARGPGRGGWLRQQEMKEEGDQQEQSGVVCV